MKKIFCIKNLQSSDNVKLFFPSAILLILSSLKIDRMKSLNFFVILLCISLCTTKLLGNPWNTNYTGNPQIRLTKTAGTVTPRGGNVFSVEWTVVIQNTGDENNVEVTSWDDDFQLANAGSPMLIDFTKCKINSMTGTANGVAITMADANPLWNVLLQIKN